MCERVWEVILRLLEIASVPVQGCKKCDRVRVSKHESVRVNEFDIVSSPIKALELGTLG